MVHGEAARPLSPVVIVGALVALLLDWNLPGAVHPLAALLAAGALLLWEHESTLAVARAGRFRSRSDASRWR